MANKTDRYASNVPGAWYVDSTCIICGMCPEYAPSVFKMNEDQTFVFRQPVTAEELAQAEEARDHCPVEAIGNDGE